ncbi:MAG: hypothetical protein AB9866_08800 [Syntrophobacteraceae bacterium]
MKESGYLFRKEWLHLSLPECILDLLVVLPKGSLMLETTWDASGWVWIRKIVSFRQTCAGDFFGIARGGAPAIHGGGSRLLRGSLSCKGGD